MTLDEAQNVAFRMANLNSWNITLLEIRQALVLLGNFYEDYKGLMEDIFGEDYKREAHNE